MKQTPTWLRERHRQHNHALRQQSYQNRSKRRNSNRRSLTDACVNAPEVFELRPKERRQILFDFIDRINTALRDGRRVRISFADTKKLLPCGTLYFVANVLLALESYPGRLFCDYPSDDVVEQLLQHIGILEKLGRTPRKQVTAENVRHWHFVSGHTTDTSPFNDLISAYRTSIQEPVRMGLYDSMSEAVTNCIQHAYCGTKHVDSMKRWWMFSQRRDDRLHVVICDLGMGIAGSLRQKPEWRDIIRRIRSRPKQDRAFVKAAVGSLRTRTGFDHRGKGLPEMLDFIRSGKAGGFLVHSNHGAFAFDANAGIERAKYYEKPFCGTLIQWELALHDGG